MMIGNPEPKPVFSESFKLKLEEIRKIIDQDQHRRRVLLLCQQTEPRSFEEYSSSGSFRKLEKFESSTYSEVLKAVDMASNNRPVVMKIMRALSRGVIKKVPSVTAKGCQSYNDILNELVVSQSLSQLHDGIVLNDKSLYKTHFFCLIHEIKVVNGNLERTLSKSKSKNRHKQQDKDKDNNNIKDQDSNSNSNSNKTDNNNNKGSDTKDDKDKDKDSTKEASKDKDKDKEKEKEKDKDISKQQHEHAISEDDRMLTEALPTEYVVTVMKHDGQPLWWMMTHKKLTPEQLTSALVQVIVGLAIAEKVYLYEHRDLHVSNILVKKTSKPNIPFVLDNQRYNVVSNGIKVTIIDATFSRLTLNGKVYFRDLTSTLRAYGSKKEPARMSLQNRSYRQMVHITRNNWEEFKPKTNLIWLTYLCETLMKNEVMKSNETLNNEIRKIRDYSLKVNTTIDLLSYFPFQNESGPMKKPSHYQNQTQVHTPQPQQQLKAPQPQLGEQLPASKIASTAASKQQQHQHQYQHQQQQQQQAKVSHPEHLKVPLKLPTQQVSHNTTTDTSQQQPLIKTLLSSGHKNADQSSNIDSNTSSNASSVASVFSNVSIASKSSKQTK